MSWALLQSFLKERVLESLSYLGVSAPKSKTPNLKLHIKSLCNPMYLYITPIQSLFTPSKGPYPTGRSSTLTSSGFLMVRREDLPSSSLGLSGLTFVRFFGFRVWGLGLGFGFRVWVKGLVLRFIV